MASSKNLAIAEPQDNPAFDRVWAELGFAQPMSVAVECDATGKFDEQDDTEWRDLLGYHSEALR